MAHCDVLTVDHPGFSHSKPRAELTLDSSGRVVRHEEAIAAGFGILDAVARYELLTARRQEAR